MKHGDEQGILWSIEPKVGRTASKVQVSKNPPPPAGYSPPSVWRPFKDSKVIGYDLETHDPDLKTKGPGNYRDAYIVGATIRYEDGQAVYYPIAHKHGCNVEGNFLGWLADQAKDFEGEMIGANLQYDLDHSYSNNVDFAKTTPRDVQMAEAILDENKLTYKLEALARERLGVGKVTDELKKLYGNNYIERFREVHAGHAEAYGIGDVELPTEIYAQQKQEITAQGLDSLWDMECGNLAPLLRMRRVGVRVDLERAERAYADITTRAAECAARIKQITGRSINVDAAEDISIAFDAAGVKYPTSATGKPSFKQKWLESHPSELAQLITQERKYRKITGTFIKGYILDSHTNGRIHGQFHPLKSDGGGTVSGRFSSSNPNLQNIPARDPELGPLMRSMFIPEEDCDWGSCDWSQIEYRFLVHYAHDLKLNGADRAAAMYLEDSATDFHQMASVITGKPRKAAKNINFGVVYGMGVAAMASNLGCSVDEAAGVLEQFHSAMPFLKEIYDLCDRRAKQRGYIRTIEGRRRRYNMWEAKFPGDHRFISRPELFKNKDPRSAMEFDELVAQRIPAKRIMTHSALNALLQGSAADLMKKAMNNIHKAGLFDVLLPHSTVHDELNVSIPRTRIGREAWAELQRMMETAIPLHIPVLAAASTGANWSEAK